MDNILIPAKTESVINSPCVRNCCLDDNDICLGCGRSLQEITRWSVATDATKLEILVLAAQRRSSSAAR